jgi:hypothetical protein
MPNRNHRPQRAEATSIEDTRPLVVNPLPELDRLHNPHDIEPDLAAMSHGVEHGGMQESRASALATRGSGGRKRSGAFGRSRTGRDISKKR